MKEEKNKQAAKGLFAGLSTGPTPTKAATQSSTTSNNILGGGSSTQNNNKFAFKGNINIKKGGSTPAAAQPQQQQAFTQQQAAPAAAAPSNGLDLLFGNVTPSQQQQAAAPKSNAMDPLSDLFGSSSISSTPKQQQAATPASSGAFDLFSTLSTPTAAPTPAAKQATSPQQQQSSGFDMFDFGVSSNNTPAAAATPAVNTTAPAVGFASNITALSQTTQIPTAQLQTLPQQQMFIENDNGDFNIQQQTKQNTTIYWINNNKPTQQRYASQSVKLQVTLPMGGNAMQFNTQRTILIDHATQQQYPVTMINNNTTLLFSMTTSPQGIGTLSLILTPSNIADASTIANNNAALNCTLHLTIGTTNYTLQTSQKQQIIPTLTVLKPLAIQTSQYGNYWKAFGTIGEFKMQLNNTKLYTNDNVNAFLQSTGVIRPVQTIKQETIAATSLVGANDQDSSAVLLHIKLLGDGNVSIHCRCKLNVVFAQMFINDVAKAIKQFLKQNNNDN
eukprot:UN00322